jgi:hypothetical protein
MLSPIEEKARALVRKKFRRLKTCILKMYLKVMSELRD